MNKLMTAAAALALMAGTAAAMPLTATEAERIRQIVPEANLELVTEAQAELLAAAAADSDLGRNPVDAKYIRAILSGEITGERSAMLSPIDAERLLLLVPEADLSELTREQAEDLAAAVNAPGFGRTAADVERLRVILMG